LDCNFDKNATDVAIEFATCDPEAQVCVDLNDSRDIDCGCSNGEDCQSGRCEGLFGAACQAKLEDGQGCNEDSDCVSGDCNFRFVRVSKAEELTSAPASTAAELTSAPVAAEPISAPVAAEPTSARVAQLGTPSSTCETTSNGNDDDDDCDDHEWSVALIVAWIFVAIAVLIFCCRLFGELHDELHDSRAPSACDNWSVRHTVFIFSWRRTQALTTMHCDHDSMTFFTSIRGLQL
jgi:hypothetical protein